MIDWNEDFGTVLELLLSLILITMLITKRKKLGNGILILISAFILGFFSDIIIFIIHHYFKNYNAIAIFNTVVMFAVFMLYFLYFRSALKLKKSKQINLFLIIVFLVSYFYNALFSPTFFTVFPLYFYFVDIAFLTLNISLLLYETFNSDKILNITSYYPFWVSIGLLSLYLGVTPLLFISYNVIIFMNIDIFFIILFFIYIISHIIMITGTFYAKKINF